MGPLRGIRIVEFAGIGPGPFAAMLLSDMGADVIKIETPAGDTLRDWKVAGVPTAWKAYSRNKRSICLNLRSSEANEILMHLVKDAHILVESFRPGTLESMNLGPARLLAENKSLIIVRISGWG